jgi:hypothetical protein
MEERVLGIACIAIGVVLLVFRDTLSRLSVEQQNRIWGTKFGKPEVDINRNSALVVAAVAFIFGILLFFQIVPLKR